MATEKEIGIGGGKTFTAEEEEKGIRRYGVGEARRRKNADSLVQGIPSPAGISLFFAQPALSLSGPT